MVSTRKDTTRKYKNISDRARYLLSREEGMDVEFKQSIDALEVTDIVAFANSENGGAILLGIKEIHLENGKQKGIIHGAPVGDKAKMNIVSKINNVFPQIEVDIIVENASKKPFYRLEIPSGTNKPYCSANGTYKIRDDGYAKPLMPGSMLNMLLERESQKFLSRFSKAAEVIEADLMQIRNRIVQELDDVEDSLKDINRKADAMMEKMGLENLKS